MKHPLWARQTCTPCSVQLKAVVALFQIHTVIKELTDTSEHFFHEIYIPLQVPVREEAAMGEGHVHAEQRQAEDSGGVGGHHTGQRAQVHVLQGGHRHVAATPPADQTHSVPIQQGQRKGQYSVIGTIGVWAPHIRSTWLEGPWTSNCNVLGDQGPTQRNFRPGGLLTVL